MPYQQNTSPYAEGNPQSKEATVKRLQQTKAVKDQAKGVAPTAQVDPFAHDPYGDIAAYQNYQFDYPIELLQAHGMTPQSFDPQRQSAMRGVQAGAQSGALGSMTSLASTSGLSEADRQAIQSQGQRQRVNLSQGAMAPINQMQAQNLYDTNQYNVTQGQQVADYNQKIQNEHAKDLATQKQQHALNMYQARLEEAALQRQLEAAAKIAGKQGV